MTNHSLLIYFLIKPKRIPLPKVDMIKKTLSTFYSVLNIFLQRKKENIPIYFII